MANAGENTLHHQLDRLFQDGTIAGLDDSELLHRYISRRDELAFEALVRLHGPMVLGLCRRLLRDRQEVEDAFQATFLILVRKAPSLRDRTLLANWLYGVAYRVAVRARMKASRRDAGKQPPEMLDEIPSVGLDTADSDWMPILDQELSRLPEKFRAPLVLCYLNGRTHEQSAGQLGIPVGTVRSRLARGRDLLKQRLTRRGVAPGAIALALEKPSIMNPLVTNVPSSLVQGTLVIVRQFQALSPATAAIGVGAASVFSLAQGVTTAMFLVQLKTALFGLVASVAVVSGAAWAVSSSPGSSRRDAATTVSAKPIAPDSGNTNVFPRAESVPEPTNSKPLAPPQVAMLDRRDSPTTKLISRGPIHEIEAQLEIAIRNYQRYLEQSRVIPPSVSQFSVGEARSKVQLVEAQLRDVIETLEEERVRLELELAKADAETAIGLVRVKIAGFRIARNERLNARIKGAVAEEDQGKDEAEVELAKAQADSSKADSDAAKAMIKLVDRRIEAAKVVLKKASAIQPPVGAAKPSSAK